MLICQPNQRGVAKGPGRMEAIIQAGADELVRGSLRVGFSRDVAEETFNVADISSDRVTPLFVGCENPQNLGLLHQSIDRVAESIRIDGAEDLVQIVHFIQRTTGMSLLADPNQPLVAGKPWFLTGRGLKRVPGVHWRVSASDAEGACWDFSMIKKVGSIPVPLMHWRISQPRDSTSWRTVWSSK